MFLLSQDEQYLDVDPSKCLIRFPAEERRRRFGEESSPNYARAVEAHRRFILQKLVKISLRFIQGKGETCNGRGESCRHLPSDFLLPPESHLARTAIAYGIGEQ
jgi:hypothetical protein